MKQNDESYLDSLLEDVSANSDNLYHELLNNDANSFQMDEKDLEDFDFNNILDDTSFDIDEDIALDDFGGEDGSWGSEGFDDFDETFRQMSQELEQESEQTSAMKEEIEDDGQSEEDPLPAMEVEETSAEEGMAAFPFSESLDSTVSSEDDSPFEDNLMESLLAGDMPGEGFGTDGLREPEAADFANDALKDRLEDSYEDPMADLDDLIGLLSEEEQNPELLDNLSMFDEEAPDQDSQEDIFSIHSLDESGEENVDVSPDKELLDEDSFLNDSMQELLEPKKQKKAKGKKLGLFKKIFGNVHDEKALEQQRKKEEAEKAANAKSKEQRKAEKEEKKKQQEEVKKEKTALDAQKKSEKAAAQKAKTDAKKEKKMQVVVEEDEGRINRVGATLVFLFFGIIAAGIILGTDSFSYTQSISKATEYFGVQKYNKAYDEVRGIEVKKKDEEIYDKIITVMYVNKQLNSYNNYYNMEMYPEALDSLLKGLERYDEYISLAKELGIKSDLDYVRQQILGELNSIFYLSEEESYQIIDSESQEIYSQKVIQAASIE